MTVNTNVFFLLSLINLTVLTIIKTKVTKQQENYFKPLEIFMSTEFIHF